MTMKNSITHNGWYMSSVTKWSYLYTVLYAFISTSKTNKK
jgi:hypothetical protein